jgi:hypothetical protein
MMVIIEAFINDCIRAGKTFQIIVICGMNDNSLIDQTQIRLTEDIDDTDGESEIGALLDTKARASGLAKYPRDFVKEGIIFVKNNKACLEKIDLTSRRVDERLILIDEAHLGNGLNGNIDKFLRRHGVFIGQQIHTWNNYPTMNHVVAISATPYSHVLASDLMENGVENELLFETIYEQPGRHHNGPERMLENGRLRQGELLIEKETGEATPFWSKVWEEAKKQCFVNGPGYLVIRACGEYHTMILTHLKRTGRNIRFIEINSENKNIRDLNPTLSKKPEALTVVLIKGSMRAGITLVHQNYIRVWVDGHSGAADAQTQAGVGRACGYGREKESYPIYCDLDAVQLAVKFYRELRKKQHLTMVPDGIQNYEAKPRRGVVYKTIISILEATANSSRIRNTGVGSRENTAQIRYTSTSLTENPAGAILKRLRISKSDYAIVVDGAPDPKALESYCKRNPNQNRAIVQAWFDRNKASYARLIRERPELVGYAVLAEDVENQPVSNPNDCQKKRSALRQVPRPAV